MIKFSFTFLIIVIGLFSCKKEDNLCNNCSVGAPPSSTTGLTFTKASGSTYTADSSYFLLVSKTLVAYYQGNAHKLVIKTSSSIPGSYSFTTTANKLIYTETATTYTASGGSINITSYSSSKISGDFISNGSGGGIIGLNGQFKDILVK